MTDEKMQIIYNACNKYTKEGLFPLFDADDFSFILLEFGVWYVKKLDKNDIEPNQVIFFMVEKFEDSKKVFTMRNFIIRTNILTPFNVEFLQNSKGALFFDSVNHKFQKDAFSVSFFVGRETPDKIARIIGGVPGTVSPASNDFAENLNSFVVPEFPDILFRK